MLRCASTEECCGVPLLGNVAVCLYWGMLRCASTEECCGVPLLGNVIRCSVQYRWTVAVNTQMSPAELCQCQGDGSICHFYKNYPRISLYTYTALVVVMCYWQPFTSMTKCDKV